MRVVYQDVYFIPSKGNILARERNSGLLLRRHRGLGGGFGLFPEIVDVLQDIDLEFAQVFNNLGIVFEFFKDCIHKLSDYEQRDLPFEFRMHFLEFGFSLLDFLDSILHPQLKALAFGANPLHLLRGQISHLFRADWLPVWARGYHRHPHLRKLETKPFLLALLRELLHVLLPRLLKSLMYFPVLYPELVAHEDFRNFLLQGLYELLHFTFEISAPARSQAYSFRIVLILEIVDITPVRRHWLHLCLMLGEGPGDEGQTGFRRAGDKKIIALLLDSDSEPDRVNGPLLPHDLEFTVF